MNPKDQERGYIELGDQVVVLSSRKGAKRVLPWARLGLAILAGALYYKRYDPALEVLFGIGLGTVFKVYIWDCGMALIRPRPRVYLDRNGLSYSNAWGFTTTTLWDEVRGIHVRRHPWSVFDCIAVEVDMKLWLSRRGWLQHSLGGYLADVSMRYYGVKTPVYMYAYRIGVSPQVFVSLVQSCAGWAEPEEPDPESE